MTANQSTIRQQKNSIVVLRKNFEDVQDAVDELADALEDGEADKELVAETYRQLAASAASIEDAAETADVIDAHSAEWRAIDNLRAAMYHASHAIALKDAPDSVIAPTPERTHSAALSDATAAAEHLELARDTQRSGSQ